MSDAQAVTEEVRALMGLDLTGLRKAWLSRWGDPPKLRSPELLRFLIAWRIQAAAHGGLDADVRRRLRGKGQPGRADNLGVGARIRRDWRGVTYEVTVCDGGYLWDGKRFASLSALALAITGVKRNGPRFFGLRDAP